MSISDKIIWLSRKYPWQFDAAMLIFGFTLGTNFFIFFKLSGIDKEITEKIMSDNGFHWAVPTLAGIMIGIVFFFLENAFFGRYVNRMKRKTRFFFKFLVYALAITASSVFVQTIVKIMTSPQNLPEALMSSVVFIQSEMFLTLFIYLMILGVALNFFKEIGNRYGHGILLNYFLGKYREPREEDRVFMFVDLNNSTSIAEKLGHIKYSRLLNKCFNDLMDILPRYHGEVYQYVGDEAVLTWRVDQVGNRSRLFSLYYDFTEYLEQQRDEYESKFGLMPAFKASVHAGKVVVTELGKQKRELAYHGDVLNTGSRILGLCKKYGQQLLITKSFIGDAKAHLPFRVNFITTVRPRGKENDVSVYGVLKPVGP